MNLVTEGRFNVLKLKHSITHRLVGHIQPNAVGAQPFRRRPMIVSIQPLVRADSHWLGMQQIQITIPLATSLIKSATFAGALQTKLARLVYNRQPLILASESSVT